MFDAFGLGVQELIVLCIIAFLLFGLPLITAVIALLLIKNPRQYSRSRHHLPPPLPRSFPMQDRQVTEEPVQTAS